MNDIEYEPQLEQADRLSDNDVSDSSLKKIRIKNLNLIVLTQININSSRGNFEILTDVDVLLISETKLHDSFPTSQFKIPGVSSPFHKNTGIVLVPCREWKCVPTAISSLFHMKSLRVLQKARIKFVARAIYTYLSFSYTYTLFICWKIKSC